MVRKGDYSVARQDPDEQTRAKDYSFAACIASLLVFLALCIIIFLAAYPWKSSNQVTLRFLIKISTIYNLLFNCRYHFTWQKSISNKVWCIWYFLQTIHFGH
jgi:hypothetical protein